ncbi:MAG: amino acid ABC transporter ATP-binding protein, partial [Gammaproteobacteria bacterium]|nr:amino acid ABC transporter ATP-binding protein [Gammaproteobacteria bacterium]
PELVGEVLQVLRDLAASGMTMLLVTHELGFARHAADTLVFMDRGEIVEQGTPVNLLDSPRTARLQAFLSRISQSRTVRGHTRGTVIPSGTGQTRAPVATAFDAASRPGQLGALVNARHGTA